MEALYGPNWEDHADEPSLYRREVQFAQHFIENGWFYGQTGRDYASNVNDWIEAGVLTPARQVTWWRQC